MYKNFAALNSSQKWNGIYEFVYRAKSYLKMQSGLKVIFLEICILLTADCDNQKKKKNKQYKFAYF